MYDKRIRCSGHIEIFDIQAILKFSLYCFYQANMIT